VVDDSLKIHPGDPLSQSRMLATERGLYNLGIFNAANLAVQNPEGQAFEKKVLLQLDEASRYTFSYGVGFEVQTGQVNNCSNHLQVVGQTLTLVPNLQGKFCSPTGSTGVSLHGTFDVSRINFRGRDQNLIFQSSLSTLQQRVLGGLESPHFRNHEGLKFSLTALYDKTQNVLTFNSKRIEGTLQLRQSFSKPNTIVYRFSYRRVNVDANTLQVSPDQIPLLSQPVRVGAPGITYIRDTRDNPLDSHKGAYNTLDLSVASSVFGSETSFGRLSLQNSTYYKLTNNKNEKKDWILARSIQLGVLEPFGNGAQSVVPLPEEFFAGGTNSHRGFSLNQAGPRDPNTGFPIGGNALFVNSIELRTPPLPIPATGDNLSVVLFHDFGNVFDTTRDLFKSFLKVRQDNLGQCLSITASAPVCDFNFMSNALGTGARYHTPIGPIRFDVSYNLNPTYFPIKVVFDPTTERTRALDHTGRFNFFFSIGQTF
jgi:outer membrane protein assembly factor BamA